MSEEWKDPPRLVDTTDDSFLRDVLRAGEAELGTETQMAEVAAKLGPIASSGGGGREGSGGGSAGGAPHATGGVVAAGFSTKVAGIVGVGALIAAAGYFASSSPTTPTGRTMASATPIAVAASASASASATADAPRAVDESAPLVSAAVTTNATASSAPARPGARLTDEDEVQLVQRAQSALKSHPAEALGLADAHARRFSNGLLAQEREVIAIDALTRLGRLESAKARARRFKERHPSSTHLGRIEVLIGSEL